jgi:CHAT domain-containing protein
MLGAPEIDSLVAKLRSAIDPETMSFEALGKLDMRAAQLLHDELLAPVETAWGSAADLVVVADGPLGRLPLAMLPTSLGQPGADLAAAPFESLKKVAWLVRRVSVSNAPSINAYARLRQLPPARRDRAAFAGFGDPQFAPRASAPAEPGTLESRGMQVRSLARRGADQAAYARLAPLPETRVEIQAIARALSADPDRDVFLGVAASRRNVLATDLSRRRVVAFATHGLVPGDLPGLTQPALALAITADPRDSPLLTLEDVLGLKLDADLVVLSACNTAAGDAQGADAVTGLGRGFFYAGSRTLLATHWPVETDSARILVTELFTRYARDPALTRAQALRNAMLAVIDGPGKTDHQGRQVFSYAHPLFWAGYALYGDGGR